jgi:hypothetical protein
MAAWLRPKIEAPFVLLDAGVRRGGDAMLRHPWLFSLLCGAIAAADYALLHLGSGR